MQRTPLKTYSTLKSYTPLKRGTIQLKRSRIKPAEITPKKELDAIVSKVVRLSYADGSGMVKCSTCPKVLHWKYMHCGHYQRRGNMSTRFMIKNLAPQCEDCNCFNDGMEKEFAKFIDESYGEGTAEIIKQEARKIERYFPFEEEIIKWDAVLQTLLEEHSGIEY